MKKLQRKNEFRLFFVLCIMLLTYSSYAQNRVISGQVNAADGGGSLPGVSVKIKGTTIGAITDYEGNYKVEVPEDATELIFSFIGFTQQTIQIGTKSVINVALQEDVEQLDEVIVVGYQVQKKSVITGAIASVKSEDITQTPVQNAAQSIQGRTPGVLVAAKSGSPGADVDIRVRGTGSNGHNNPLFVVDGVQMDDIKYLNPSDIESMEVLKDASSAAIYGSRGANGVILVTTKQGKEGRTTVSYDGYYGIQEPWRKTPVMNAHEYMTFHNEGAKNGNTGQIPFDNDALNNIKNDTDWQDEVFHSSPIQSHNVQVAGGTDKSSYLASVSYFGQEGIVAPEKSKFDRYTVRLNTSQKLSEYFRMGVNMAFSREEKSDVGGIFQDALLHDPLTPVFEDDLSIVASDYETKIPKPANLNGRYYGISNRNLNETYNPLAKIHNANNENVDNKFIANAFLEITPGIKGLKFKTDIATTIKGWYNRSYGEPVYWNEQRQDHNSWINQASGNETVLQWENVLTYNKKLGNHNLDFLVGTTARRSVNRGNSSSGTNMKILGWDYAWVDNSAEGKTRNSGGYYGEHRLASFFGKVGYNYKEKYLFSATGRYDGSSNFGDNNKFSFFPSFQAGWILTQEEFLKNSDVLTFLKLRGSWGRVGNENIGAFGYMAKIESTNPYITGRGDVLTPGMAEQKMSNDNLKWETAEEFDLGLDVGFLNDMFTATFDLYSRQRKDLLSDLKIPGFIGLASPSYNLGTVQNQGVELALTYSKRNGDFNFDITASGSYNDNKVLELNNDDGYINGEGLAGGKGNNRIEEGYAMHYIYGFKTNGIFQNQSEVDAYTKDGNVIQPNAQAGDIRYVDINNDGKIDDEDRTYIGEPLHKWMYGLNVRMNYKNWDLAMFWQGQAGANIVNSTLRMDNLEGQNYPKRWLNRWTEEGSTNDFPRFTYKDENRNYNNLNDMVHVESSDYLRLKNLQIGYTLPQKISKKAGMSKTRIYVSGNNLLTFTNYSGLDPEVGTQTFDGGSYPQARSYLLGLNVTF
ncbi:SusC/RagA family TonB-linked outer membrane protein [Flammeovirga kamogawensis]|uniref:TonB-dependent receptor n=1 Tax=Flammeovirga kamogawensis TaxID=373891 RepID=A0ABX8GQL5_9BACT|nr:TonB-dependent receptor [Flammeovirga kamogawensis]MBB6463086.1 TonB-linked SusC/RagA family outer membrane protein [Flammeovirga kamogawensis]QWG05721.1 TonB-dependent receptor [Flammeovirga kamogawensis]TRX67550.1 TonB-dependent receptor [Flammeovirga kamogawensis]